MSCSNERPTKIKNNRNHWNNSNAFWSRTIQTFHTCDSLNYLIHRVHSRINAKDRASDFALFSTDLNKNQLHFDVYNSDDLWNIYRNSFCWNTYEDSLKALIVSRESTETNDLNPLRIACSMCVCWMIVVLLLKWSLNRFYVYALNGCFMENMVLCVRMIFQNQK